MLRLRKTEPFDLPFLYQWENDASAWADGNNHNPLSETDLRNYIESTTGDLYKDGQLRLIIEEQQGDEKITVGCLDLFDLDPRNGRAAVGIYIAPAFRGKGYGKQALQQLDDYTFGFLHLRLLYAFVSHRNTASQQLFRQAGYTPSANIPHWTREGDATVWWKTTFN